MKSVFKQNRTYSVFALKSFNVKHKEMYTHIHYAHTFRLCSTYVDFYVRDKKIKVHDRAANCQFANGVMRELFLNCKYRTRPLKGVLCSK